MLVRLGHLVSRRPLAAIAAWALIAICSFIAVSGVGGTSLFDRLVVGEPTAANSESSQADKILLADTAVNRSLALIVSNVDLTNPALAAAVDKPRQALAAIPGVTSVVDPLALPGGAGNSAAAPLVGKDGRAMLMVVELDAALSDGDATPVLAAVEERLQATARTIETTVPGSTGVVGGRSMIVDSISSQVERDLTTGELIAFPIALLVMVAVFGGLLAAAVPLAGALASIAAGLGTLWVASTLTELDSSVINVISLLGLGLSIDYGLLLVSRFREEVGLDPHHGSMSREGTPRVSALDNPALPGDPTAANASLPQAAAWHRRVWRISADPAVEAAVVATMQTAGRTVGFSGLTVAISISGLLLFEPRILRAFGLAGVGIVVIALATSVTLTPALLALFGTRLTSDRFIERIPGVRRLVARTADVHTDTGIFSTLAARVQRRPWWVIGGVLLLLALLAAPVAGLQMRNSGTEMLPKGHPERTYSETLAANFPAAVEAPIVVLAFTSLAAGQDWAVDLRSVRGVASVDAPSDLGSVVAIRVHPLAADPAGQAARDVVERIRDEPTTFDVLVTGESARQLDFAKSVARSAPMAALVVVLAALVLLFLMTGSIVVPVKALLTNLVSIAAALGVVVWIFQDGNLEGLLGFTATGGIETYVVVLFVAFALGLAMDYEVFLLARIKELVDTGMTTDEAVRVGLQRSGRIITSAAAVIVVVFAGFVAGHLLVIKEVGVALSVVVIIDVTLVRMLLVPATMTVLGRHNWWAPEPLARLHKRWGAGH